MRIPMLDGWEKRVRRESLSNGQKEKELIDKVFDGLRADGKLDWATKHTPTGYPVFVACGI